MAKARRNPTFTRAEIVRVLRAYEDAGLPPPRMVMRRDGVIFEPTSKKASADGSDNEEPAVEQREPWIM